MILTVYNEKLRNRTLREEGRAEGFRQTNSLNSHLLDDNRLDDLKRSLKDSEFQEKLLKEYGLNSDESDALDDLFL